VIGAILSYINGLILVGGGARPTSVPNCSTSIQN
jgi:hypothetical protein